MNDQECSCCHARGPRRADLTHGETGSRITVCLRCLRSAMQMKAAVADPRGRFLLFEYAERFAWNVWESSHALYLLPSIAPFNPSTDATAASSVAIASGPLGNRPILNDSDASLP